MDLHDHFATPAKNARWSKKSGWDGRIRLFRLDTKTLHRGHLPELEQWCSSKDYTFETDKDEKNKVSIKAIKKEFGYLLFEPHDFQLEATQFAVNEKRAVIVSPTRSGKTLIAYFLAKLLPSPMLIIVPTKSLVLQMQKDFLSYGGAERGRSQIIMQGHSKEITEDIVITTQGSARNQPPSWFNSFGAVIADEVHEYDARTLRGMIEKSTEVKYCYGMTGSLKDSKTSTKTLTGLFGPLYTTATTKELMDRGVVSGLTIKTIVLDYSDEDRRAAHGLSYNDEMKFIIGHKKRNEILLELAKEVKGNALMMFFYVDEHGKLLYNGAVNRVDNKIVHYVDGGVDGEIREDIRAAFEASDGNLGITSYKTFSTGITISNLLHIILASPSKSRVRNLQTIGRGLGLHLNKISVTVWDFVDDLRWQGDTNYTLKHFEERLVIYNQEDFNYEIYRVKVG